MSNQAELKKAVLKRLVAYRDASVGCPARIFADMLCEMGIAEWAPFLKSLCEEGSVRLDPPKGSRTEAVIKVLPKAYETLELT